MHGSFTPLLVDSEGESTDAVAKLRVECARWEKPSPAAWRRDVKARHGSTGKTEVEQIESA